MNDTIIITMTVTPASQITVIARDIKKCEGNSLKVILDSGRQLWFKGTAEMIDAAINNAWKYKRVNIRNVDVFRHPLAKDILSSACENEYEQRWLEFTSHENSKGEISNLDIDAYAEHIGEKAMEFLSDNGLELVSIRYVRPDGLKITLGYALRDSSGLHFAECAENRPVKNKLIQSTYGLFSAIVRLDRETKARGEELDWSAIDVYPDPEWDYEDYDAYQDYLSEIDWKQAQINRLYRHDLCGHGKATPSLALSALDAIDATDYGISSRLCMIDGCDDPITATYDVNSRLCTIDGCDDPITADPDVAEREDYLKEDHL